MRFISAKFVRTSLRLPFGTYQLAKFFFNYHVSGVKLEISNRGFHFFAILKNPLTIYKNLCNWETNFYIRYINKKKKKRKSLPEDNFERVIGIHSGVERMLESAKVFWVVVRGLVPWVSRWALEGARPFRSGGRKRTFCYFLLRPRSIGTCAIGPLLSLLVPA